ncbi:MAG: NUDIX hydrolase [Muribaculaceae bacterium]|nr:NUDIX hydrolase [Muribaculaceae bacterium]
MSEIKKWDILDSQYIIKRPWLTARKDRVKLPNGQINDEFYVLEYPDWVNVIAVTEDGDFVMIEQYRHGLGRVQTEICAGVVESGERHLDAAKRELLEESGYGDGDWRLLTILSGNPSTTNNLTYCYVAEGVRKISSQHLDRTEDVAVRLLSRDKVIELLRKDDMKQSLMVAPLLRYLFMPET